MQPIKCPTCEVSRAMQNFCRSCAAAHPLKLDVANLLTDGAHVEEIVGARTAFPCNGCRYLAAAQSRCTDCSVPPNERKMFCTGCDRELPLMLFVPKTGPESLHELCHDCRSLRSVRYYVSNAYHAMLRNADRKSPRVTAMIAEIVAEIGAFRCIGCGQEKAPGMFRKDPRALNGLHGRCRLCECAADRARRAKMLSQKEARNLKAKPKARAKAKKGTQ